MAVAIADATGLLEYLAEEKVATVALPIDREGSIHIATMNYAHTVQPLRFYFMTSDESQKCTLLNATAELSAACTVGTYTHVPFTLQMRGVIRKIDKVENDHLLAVYYEKRGDKNRNVEGPHSVLLEFEPHWARFTDFSKGWDTTMLDLG